MRIGGDGRVRHGGHRATLVGPHVRAAHDHVGVLSRGNTSKADDPSAAAETILRGDVAFLRGASCGARAELIGKWLQ